MRPLFNHDLITSFALFLDHELLDGAQAYTNVTTGLFHMGVTPAPSSQHVWAAPFKSWVSDSCVSGAAIPSGVYNSSGQFLTRDSGIVIDFENGRVMSPHNWGPRLSGTFARRDYNIYTSTDGQVEWWMENVYGANKNITYTPTGIPAGPFAAPCIILTNSFEQNEPWALGGMDQTRNTLVGYIISNNGYQQEGVNSYTRDLADRSFALATYGDAPWGSSGDLKARYYCYDDLCARYGPAGAYIEEVHNRRVSQAANKSTSFMVSVVEFDTNVVRQARAAR